MEFGAKSQDEGIEVRLEKLYEELDKRNQEVSTLTNQYMELLDEYYKLS